MDYRDLLAGVVAGGLALFAVGVAELLRIHRRRRDRARDSERALGRTIVAEIPVGNELRFFSEDSGSFSFGDAGIRKDAITGVRVLVNRAPIAAAGAGRAGDALTAAPTFEDRPEGIARDRWDVEIFTERETVLVPCGALRERISQELARGVYEAVKRALKAPPENGKRGT